MATAKLSTEKMRVIARHSRWVDGAMITESVNDNNDRRFVATIRGWRNWLVWEGRYPPPDGLTDAIMDKVAEIRDRIDAGDDEVFNLPKPLISSPAPPAAAVAFPEVF